MVQTTEKVIEVKKYYYDHCGKDLSDDSDCNIGNYFSVSFADKIGLNIPFNENAYNGKYFTNDFKDILFCKKCSDELTKDIFYPALDKILKFANKENKEIYSDFAKNK